MTRKPDLPPTGPWDLAVIGAGAAGLMAAISAARATSGPGRIVLLDGAARLGAKILVSGGGRCNVTHERVDETAFAGSSPPAIRKVLRRFDVPETIAFFRDLGIELKREETGKLFPETDSARSVLGALLRGAADAGVAVRNPWRVERVERAGDGFRLHAGSPRGAGVSRSGAAPPPPDDPLTARRVILATGGRSLPRTGSDGFGYDLARSLGHTVTERVFPALVPLTLPAEHPLTALTGLSAEVRVEVRSGSDRRIADFTGSLLCTHFGLSGPAILDVSRFYQDALADDPRTTLAVNWRPDTPGDRLDRELREGRTNVLRILARTLPERLARALCDLAGVPATTPLAGLTRADRRNLVRTVTGLRVPVTGNRGFRVAEVTAGGVPLSELHLKTLESRITPGLHLCGEICDVDGRIGGFNFQWAWASGFVAGTGAAGLPVRET